MGWILKGSESENPERLSDMRELGIVARNTERKCDEMKKLILKNGVNRWMWKHVTLV